MNRKDRKENRQNEQAPTSQENYLLMDEHEKDRETQHAVARIQKAIHRILYLEGSDNTRNEDQTESGNSERFPPINT